MIDHVLTNATWHDIRLQTIYPKIRKVESISGMCKGKLKIKEKLSQYNKNLFVDLNIVVTKIA